MSAVPDYNKRPPPKEVVLPQHNSQRIEQVARALITKTGFMISPGATISFTDGSRTLTITPDSTEFYYWIQGVKYTKTAADTVVIDDTEGVWYIYYVADVLTASQTPWVISDGDKAFVAIINWDAVNNTGICVGYELHSYDMPVGTHARIHYTEGTNFTSGFALVEGIGGDDGKVAMEGGIIWDEDIKITIVDGAGSGLWEQELGNTSVFAPAQIPVFYRSGASAWRKYVVTDFPYYDNATVDNVHYNLYSAPNWASTEASSSAKYIAMWIFGTPSITEPIITIMGQNVSDTLNQAKAVDQIENLSFGSCPFEEYKILFRLIFKSDGTHAHTEDMRRVANVPGGTYVPQPTPSLDGVCTIGSEYDGAISEATAMKIGDGIDALLIYTSATIPRIKRIDGAYIWIESDNATNVGFIFYDDATHYYECSFNKNLHYGRAMITGGTYKIGANGDHTNHLDFSVAGGVMTVAFQNNEGLIINVGDPTNAQDVATKHYVDNVIGVGGHDHDGDTLQLDAINSDGGAFPFATTGSIGIDMVNAGATILSITNSGAGVASLDVTGNITVSGTVDGVDIADRDHAKYTDADALAIVGMSVIRTFNGTIDFDGNGVIDASTILLETNTNGGLIYVIPTTDHRFHGDSLIITTSGGSFGIPMCADINTDNQVIVCDGDDANKIPCIGVWVINGMILVSGFIRDENWAFTRGKPVYVSDVGVFTTTVPGNVGDYVQVCGVSLSADSMLFRPSYNMVLRK